MRRCGIAGVLIVFLTVLAGAQTFPTPSYFQRMFTRPQMPSTVPGFEGIDTYVVEGKLRLSLDDMIALTLANNTDVRINSLQLQLSAFAFKRAYQPFDPVFTFSFSPERSTSFDTSTDDAGVVHAIKSTSLGHAGALGYSQFFQTGTSFSTSLSSNRYAGTPDWSPGYTSALTFSLTQPLLRGRGLLPNRSPIIIAQRNLKQSHADFEAQVNNSISSAINQYWDVVQSRQELQVLRKSLELADATYARNKRELELGALPPLDIFRSESQVAQRKLSVVQAEYRLRQIEDDFRRTIGADLDPRYSTVTLDLTENAEVTGELPVVDAKEALDKALGNRPELESLRLQLANATTTADVANHNLKPDLDLSAYYTSSGFDQFVSGGALANSNFGNAMSQLGGFNYPTYGFSLDLRLPLRNRAAEADLGAALVNRKRTLYQTRQRVQAITLEIRDSLNQVEGAKMAIDAARTLLDLSRKNLAAEQRKYELGVQTIFFVLDAQTQLAQAEASLVQAQISYRRATTALDRATGELLQHYRIQIANVAN